MRKAKTKNVCHIPADDYLPRSIHLRASHEPLDNRPSARYLAADELRTEPLDRPLDLRPQLIR